MHGPHAARRFLPLFTAQMLGALNDNLFKNALIVLVLYRGSGRAALVPLAGAVFVLPYALFSALAGQLADRFDKARLIRLTKLYELGLMALAAAGFLASDEWFLLLVLFGLGVQATFFGPLKYGILPELLSREDLAQGNGLIEAGTFIGIVLGTVLGPPLILLPHGRLAAAAAVLAVALGGWLAARALPGLPPASPGLALNANAAAATADLLRQAARQRTIWRSILAISWFWGFGAAFLTELPLLARQNFGATGALLSLLLGVFAAGIGAGSLAAARLMQGRITTRPAVPAALVLSLAALDFCRLAARATPLGAFRSVPALLGHATGLHAVADLFVVAAAGGVFSVPLYALLQIAAPPEWRARMIAANNVMNAVFMVAASLLLLLGAHFGLPPAALLAAFAAANLLAAFLLHRARLP